MVPLSPDLCWGEHTTRSAHVTESSLSSTVGSSSRDTGNTGNSTTCRNNNLAIVPRGLYICTHPLAEFEVQQHRHVLPIYKLCALTSSPGLSRGLVTSLLAHGIWLTLILGHSSVDGLNDIWADGRGEDLYIRPSARTQISQFHLLIPSFPKISISSNLRASKSSTCSYLWERVSRTAGSAIGGQDGNGRSGSHLEGF